MSLTPTQSFMTKAKLSKPDQYDLSSIESSISHMRTLTPPDPYILTIPQDVEPRYHHSYAYQARQWLHNTPFDYREHESTQYQTFVYHEPGEDMYMLHKPPEYGVDEGGSVSVNVSRVGTGANTPAGVGVGEKGAGAGPKKTISLSAYKKKQTGMTPDASSVGEAAQRDEKRAAVKGPVERVKADEEVLAAVEDGEDALKEIQINEGRRDLKRKRTETVTSRGSVNGSGREQMTKPDGEMERAQKAGRTSSPVTRGEKNRSNSPVSEQAGKPKESQGEPQSVSHAEASAANALPPRLSPPRQPSPEEAALPPKLSSPRLPSRLSPTIPNNINATLTARAHHRSISRSSEMNGSRSASKNRDSRHLTPPPKAVPRNAFRANSSSPAVRSDSEQRARAKASAPSGVKTPEPKKQESGDLLRVERPENANPRKDIVNGKEKLLVKFKFKKSQREAVRRILRMRPNPVKAAAPGNDEKAAEKRASSSAADMRDRSRRDTNAKGVAQEIGPATNGVSRKEEAARSTSPERKRQREHETDDSDNGPRKKKKPAREAIDIKKQEPSTPAAASDLLSPSSAQKSNVQLTPSTMRKDVLSQAMKREPSTDSRLNTPLAISQNSPTAKGTSQPSHQGTGTTRQPSNKTPKQQAWEHEQKRLETLGRELKHAATDHLKSLSLTYSDPHAPSTEQKLAAVKALESLLSYILAFICADEAALAADPKMQPSVKPWRSLHGFFGFVKRHCEPFPPLLGLACWLGVVFNARILELIASSPNSSNSDQGPSRDTIVETQVMMQRAAIEADAKLDVDLLQLEFPRSWEGRFKGSLAPASEQLEVGKGFHGLYKLPLGLQTSALRGARAGATMLGEWVGKEVGGGVYELRLKLWR